MMTQNNVALGLPNSSNITRAVLSNGVTVLVRANPSVKSVVLVGQMRGGSLYESPQHNGLASMTAASLMRGTESRDLQAIASRLEDIGADFDFAAGVHHVSFGGKALAEDLPVLIDTLADCVMNPVFPSDQVDRLRGEVMTWLQYSLQDTRRQASRAFRESLYDASHPYHYSPRGTLESLPGIDAQMLKQFHASQYGPDGVTIVIVGAVDPAAAVDAVRAKLESWTAPDQAPARSVGSAANVDRTIHTVVPIPGKTQSDVVIGVVGPERRSPDFQAARIANSILGEFGMMGRIGDEVREKAGLAYYAYSRIEGGYGPGAWSISAGVNPANVERAVDLSLQEVRKMAAEHVTDTELDDNKSYFIGRMPLQLETNEGLAGAILSMETFELGLDYLVEYPAQINAVTADGVREAIQTYWTPDAVVVAVAGAADQG
ncbi:MAG: insulinase family protein [Chloroflexi bacterium]|nr:insulinase family protein [Chloroflexota bacterium]